MVFNFHIIGGLWLGSREGCLYVEWFCACTLWFLIRGGLSLEGSLKRGTTVAEWSPNITLHCDLGAGKHTPIAVSGLLIYKKSLLPPSKNRKENVLSGITYSMIKDVR